MSINHSNNKNKSHAESTENKDRFSCNDSEKANTKDVEFKKVGFFSFLLDLCLIVFFCSTLAASVLIYYYKKATENLPSYEKILNYKPSESTFIYSKEGAKIAEFAEEHRVYVPISAVPQQLINAFIAAEDKNFYTNRGIDFDGIMRAAWKNIQVLLRGNKERYSGASTITQQVVRNVLLSPQRTIDRKIKEFVLSRKLSTIMAKDKILEIYLNHIYLGSRAYGIVAASHQYFNKEIANLGLSEIALLASLPKAPSALDPSKNPTRATERRNWVLSRMYNDGFITQEQMKSAQQEKITLSSKKKHYLGWSFVDYVKKKITDSGIPEERLSSGGLRIHTTMNSKWQKIAQEALDNGLQKFDQRRGYRGPIQRVKIEKNAKKEDLLLILKNIEKPEKIKYQKLALVLQAESDRLQIIVEDGFYGTILMKDMNFPDLVTPENKTKYKFIHGDVILTERVAPEKLQDESYAGHKNYYQLQQIPQVEGGVVIMSNSGELKAMVGGYADLPGIFNRTYQANRQPGSSIKPFVYIAALESGLAPNEIFMDSEMYFSLGGGKVWTPKNHNNRYLGPVTLRMGLESSINTVTIRIADSIGIGKVLNMFKRFDVIKYAQPNLSVALGSGETTLLNLARAYAVIANYGIDVRPFAIDKIIDRNNNSLQFTEPDERDLDKNKILAKNENENLEEDGWVTSKEKSENPIFNKKQIIDKQVAYQAISLMQGTFLRGTASGKAKDLQIPLAGKTGTSQGGRDLWFVGFSPEIVVAIYVGYDIPIEIKEYGATAALPIFIDIIKKLQPELKTEEFPIPDGIKFIKINRKSGQQTNDPIGNNVIYEVFKAGDKIGTPPPLQEESKIDDSTSMQNLLEDIY